MSKILVVEDDADIRELIAMSLLEEGHELHAVEHGQAALAALAAFDAKLIVLDLRMPVMDGLEFLRVYRASEGPHAHIIAMTAAPDAGLTASEIGVDAVLFKPFALEDLLGYVEALQET